MEFDPLVIVQVGRPALLREFTIRQTILAGRPEIRIDLQPITGWIREPRDVGFFSGSHSCPQRRLALRHPRGSVLLSQWGGPGVSFRRGLALLIHRFEDTALS